MTGLLSDQEMSELTPAELCPHRTPIPTQIVSSDEYYPAPQTEKQREVEARLLAMADELGGKQGLSRRRFFQTAAGMAAAFVAMNEVYGEIFDVSAAEAATPDMAQERADALKDQFIMDMHTHFLRDDTRLTSFRRHAPGGRQGRLEQGAGRQGTDHRGPEVRQLLQGNLPRQRHQDRADLLGAVGNPAGLVPTNEQMAQARAKVNKEAGARRLFAHAIFTPGQPGWLDEDRAAHRAQAGILQGLYDRRQHPQGT